MGNPPRLLLWLFRVPSIAYPLLAGLIVLLLPWLGVSRYWVIQIAYSLIFMLVVSGLNLSMGYAGELALGQGAIFAAGAYTAAVLGKHGFHDILITVPAAALVALLVGLLSGIPGLRLGEWSLAMVSFFLVVILPDIVNIFSGQTGGLNGAVIPIPTVGGMTLGIRGLYVAVVVVAVIWLAVLRNLVTSRHGGALRVVRESRVLASSIGISVYWLKLIVYALGAVPAGAAGALFAYLVVFVSPGTFTFTLIVSFFAASIIGGSESVYGAILGAALLEFVPLALTSFQRYSLVTYGVFLIAGGVILSGGIAGLSTSFIRRIARHYSITTTTSHPEPVSGIQHALGGTLEIRGVGKVFGGVAALDEVTFTAPKGQITAVIGPNGSGKTTLLNLISGFYRVDKGAVVLDGKELEGRESYRISRAGVARTFQTPHIPKSLTAGQVIATGRYSSNRSSMGSAVLRLPSYRATDRDDGTETDRILHGLGMLAVRDQPAVSLPLGTRRLLEVGRCLASRPKVLLLDEPASGLDQDEIATLGNILSEIRAAGSTVVLVEHNFSFVISLADQVIVLANGQVLAAGTPDEIASNPTVQREYLGEMGDAFPDSGVPIGTSSEWRSKADD